jgi:hypothetical protein
MNAFPYPTGRLLNIIARLVFHFQDKAIHSAEEAAIKDAIKIYKELTGKEP